MRSLRRMAPFVQPYWLVAFFLLATTIVPAVMELLVPRVLSYIIDAGIEAGDMTVILQGSLVMLGAALLGALATLGQGVFRAQLSQNMAYDMRNRLFAHVQDFSFANLDHMQTGELITRLSSDVDLVRMFISAGVALFLRVALMILGSVVMMFIIDWLLAMIMVVLLPLAGLLIWGVMHLAQPMFVIVQEKLAALNTTVQENLAGVQVVKAFVRERFEIGRFQGFNEDYMAENIKVGRLTAVASPMLAILAGLGTVAVVWFGGMSVISDRLSLGELVAFNSYLLIGMAPLLLLGNILTMFTRAEASAGRIWEVLDMEPALEVPDSPHMNGVIQGRVCFENVSFHYGDSDDGQLSDSSLAGEKKQVSSRPTVLHNVSFDVEPGQQVALLGATGSGKSTLVNLIPRFYDVSSGDITVDGVDVRVWQPEALRRRIGVVLQQTILFSGTVRENIAYGRPEASLEEIIAAAKAAQAHEFISAMPAGYDALIGERGVNLSGGQKQRIAIARALLISPSILILDDSTSSVDMQTEVKIQQALETVMRDCTTVIVAQRLSSVLKSDKIIILDHGRVVDQGTHRQLLARNAIYQEIYDSQMGGT